MNQKVIPLPPRCFSSDLFLNLAEAQQPKKVQRIGYLSAADAATESARSEAIRLALRERGYMEGQNIASEYRYAEGKARSEPRACGRAGASQGRYHRGSRRGTT